MCPSSANSLPIYKELESNAGISDITLGSEVELDNKTYRWLLGGQVQGVGFRPFVYRIAMQYRLKGYVQNQSGQVEILSQGNELAQQAFEDELFHHAPSIAKPELICKEAVASNAYTDFTIISSKQTQDVQVHVPVDYFTCDDCLAELKDVNNRRHRYPFINCTQCGPRYTLIEKLPYDRKNTSMSEFDLCSACFAEYKNPLDRRFHAEPIACPECGPRLTYVNQQAAISIDNTQDALHATVQDLNAGKIIAVKGIGGYHLMCDACNDEAVKRLRAHKKRPHKPLAVMFPQSGKNGLAYARGEVVLNKLEEKLLCDTARPIVLTKQRSNRPLSKHIAPGLQEIGIFLPYSPLHHILLHDFGRPLVATSGNISGEPVLTDNTEAQTRLQSIADTFLHHERTIVRPADDSIVRVINRKARVLRSGRGYAPLELQLPFTLFNPVLAVGGHLKNTVALAWQDRVIISPHIGEMNSPRSLKVLQQTVNDLQKLYSVDAETILCDAHPGYATTRWAKMCKLNVQPIFHHRAHASALMGEHGISEKCLVFTWDGTGFGEDDSLWGGETLLGNSGNWQRVASMRPFCLPGGDKVGHQPWRAAAAVCWETDKAWVHDGKDTSLLFEAWQQKLNCPQSTAVGRLFDAAASLITKTYATSYEAQGPMQLEALCKITGEKINLPLNKDVEGIWRTDWEPLITYIQDESKTMQQRAEAFHTSMGYAVLNQAQHLREQHQVIQVGLTGGVFQNRVLTELAVKLLEEDGFIVYLSEKVPCNDAGISLGQIIEYGALVNLK